MLRQVFAAAMVLAVAGFSFAQQAPAAGPAKTLEKQPYVLGPAQVQEYPEQTFFYVTTDATQKTMPEVMRKLMPHLAEAAKAGGIQAPSGPVLLVYHGASADPDAKFELEAGFLVPENVKASGSAEVRKLESFRCASMLFTGKIENIGKAYESIFTNILGTIGGVPTMEMRQMMLYWESDTSNNNIMLLQVGMQ